MEGGGVCKTQMREFHFADNSSYNLRTLYNTSSIQSLHYIGDGDFWIGMPDVGLVHYNIPQRTSPQYVANTRVEPDVRQHHRHLDPPQKNRRNILVRNQRYGNMDL